MDLPVFLIMGGCYIIFALFVIITILITLLRGVKECKNNFSSAVLLFSEIIFTIIGPIIGFIRFDRYQPDIPFSKQHVLSIILLVIISSISFWIARFTKNSTSPVLRIFVSVGLLQGVILCFITSIHFLPFFALGIIYPTLGFELLSPIFAGFILFRELYFYNKTDSSSPLSLTALDQLLPYCKELGFLPLPFLIFQKPLFIKLFIYTGLLIPFIAIQIMFAYGFDQEINSIVKAFTHSHGFIFSRNNY